MSKSKIFLYFCLSFIAGVSLRSFLNISFFQNYILFLISAVIAVLFSGKIRWLALGGIFIFLGILIYNFHLPQTDQAKIYFYNDQTAIWQGVVAKEPEIKIDKQRLTIESHTVILSGTKNPDDSVADTGSFTGVQDDNRKQRNNLRQKVSGKVLVSTKLYPKYNYGDFLEISCELNTPQKIEDFDYPNYLFPKKIYSLCYYPKIKIIAKDKGNIFLTKVLVIKNKLQSIVNFCLPEPQASLFSALTLGNRSALPQQLLEKFKKAGVSHIIAISGLHVAIIGLILSNLFLAFYIPKKYAFYLSCFFIFLFVVLTGARSSVVRAGIMGFLILWAAREGRLNKAINALVFSAVLMLLINPFLLRYDIGFQLSFLAVLGIIYFYPFFNNLNFFSLLPDFLKLKSIFLITISAQLATLPLILYHFHYYSFISPLTNIFILPVLPFVMILGFLFLLLGLIYLPLAKIFFVLIYLFLSYIIKVVEII